MSPEQSRKARKLERERRRQASQNIILYVIAAVALLIIALFVFPYIRDLTRSSAEAPAAPISLSDSAVCREFDSIPLADQYQQPPMKIDQTKTYFATFKMAKGGSFVVQLYADKAPITVNSFVFLSCKGFYNGLTFHRVIDGFMAQGGDPTGVGAGGPGYQFVDEPNGLVFDRAGILAMANSGPDTNGSQFFITYAATDWLNGKHTIFGEVTEGMDVVNGLKRGDPNTPGFQGDVIESVTISE